MKAPSNDHADARDRRRLGAVAARRPAPVRIHGSRRIRVRGAGWPLALHRAAKDGAGDELVPDRRRTAVHPDG